MAMQKHYVEFLSPGTLVAESTRKEIDGWDIEQAICMARDVTERHGATPYGFVFITRSRNEDEMDARETARSGTYYLGGKIETLEEVEARDDPKEDILRSNMRINGWHKIVVNTNSWKWTQPLREGDTVLDFTP